MWINSDNDVGYGVPPNGAEDSVTGVYLNSGTCSYSLINSKGVELGNGDMPYIAASDGYYLGVIDATVSGLLGINEKCKVVITFVQGDYNDQRTLYDVGELRGAS